MQENQKLVEQLSIRQKKAKEEALVILREFLSGRFHKQLSDMISTNNGEFNIIYPDSCLSKTDVKDELEELLKTYVPRSGLTDKEKDCYIWETTDRTLLGEIDMTHFKNCETIGNSLANFRTITFVLSNTAFGDLM